MCPIIIQYPKFPQNYLTIIALTPVCMLSITIIHSHNYYVRYQVIVIIPGCSNYHLGLMVWNMNTKVCFLHCYQVFLLFPTTYLLQLFMISTTRVRIYSPPIFYRHSAYCPLTAISATCGSLYVSTQALFLFWFFLELATCYYFICNRNFRLYLD